VDLAWEGSVGSESAGSKDETGGDIPGDGEHRRDCPEVAHLTEPRPQMGESVP
jgi:hypothetical protein